MMSLLRKHRNWLMIVIAILALPFCLYFVKTDYTKLTTDKFARVYGRDITMVEAQRNGRLCGLAQELGMLTLVRSLALGAQSQEDVGRLFALNRFVLHHEADRLGIRPTSSEIAELIRNLRAFHGPNGFDPKKFDEMTQNLLPANGFSEAQLEELAGDEICLRRIKDLVTGPVTMPDAELKTQYEQLYGTVVASVIKIRGQDFLKDINITDEDLHKYYEAHKAEYKTDEKRKVELAGLTLTEEQKKLVGKERIDALQKLANRADEFNQALLEKGADFHAVAAKFNAPVQETGEFTRNNPDPKFKADQQLTAAAFQLTKAEPISDAVQGSDGFYVLHLLSAEEARPLSFDEAKPKVTEGLKRNRVMQMVSNKGAQVARELRETLASGAPLSFALQKANVKAEKVEPFTLADDLEAQENPEKPKEQKERGPEFIAVKNAVRNLQPNEVSEFFPWEDGGIIAILEKREAPDDAKFAAKKTTLQERMLTNKRDMVFYEWLADRQREAGIINSEAAAKPGKPG